MQGEKPRFYILDLVRGLAVFLMLLAHAVYFFHARDSQLLLGAETLGNTVCFIAFLIVSGATTYVSYLSQPYSAEASRRLGKRLLMLLLSYYLIALFVISKDISTAVGLDKLKLVADILLLRNLPSYTEYIVPFILFPWLASFFKIRLQKIARNLRAVFLISALVYGLGMLLFYYLPLPSLLLPWKALLVGSEGYYRFPILQYLPVYMLGIYWGAELLARENLKTKRSFVLNVSIISLVLILLIAYLARSFGWDFAVLARRWPPSVYFLLIGSFFTFVFAYIFYLAKRLNGLPIVRDFLLIIGQNAFALFWAHIFLLTAYKMMGGAQVSSVFTFLFIFIVFWLLCFALAVILPFNFKFALNFVKYSQEQAEEYWEKSSLVKFEEEIASSSRNEGRWLKRYFLPSDDGSRKRRKLIRKRHLLLGLVIGAVVAILISPIVLDEAKTIMRSRQTVTWWDDSYGYRQSLSVTNQSAFSNLIAGQTVELSLDHRYLVENNFVKPDGADFRILYLSNSGYKEVEFKVLNGWNLNNSLLSFKLSQKILAGKADSNYFLYFGNYQALSIAVDFVQNNPNTGYGLTLGEMQTHALALKVDKRWHLIGEDGDSDYLQVSVEPKVDIREGEMNYRIVGTDINGKLSQIDGIYSAKVAISKLDPGSYQIEASVKQDGNDYSSQRESFFVSYPLYVAWTLDWEGYDASNGYLTAMSDIATKYQVPMTHFYNPRTTITTTISAERKAYLLSWLKQRLDKGDGTELHLHMFYDLVEASGLVVKNEPRWSSGSDGYDVPVTAYSKDELKQIILRCMEEMRAQGLPEPEIFRAGAWFADEQTLQAIQELGFVADSSGRTAYKFGATNMTGPWNLQPSTQPYQPSREDQNTASINKSIGILEIPNNGADSYWFSAEEMIERFKANYSGKALESLKQVTFLSHPHWFKAAEQQKVKSLFDYVSQYRYSDDSGPVIYATSEQIFRAWADR